MGKSHYIPMYDANFCFARSVADGRTYKMAGRALLESHFINRLPDEKEYILRTAATYEKSRNKTPTPRVTLGGLLLARFQLLFDSLLPLGVSKTRKGTQVDLTGQRNSH